MGFGPANDVVSRNVVKIADPSLEELCQVIIRILNFKVDEKQTPSTTVEIGFHKSQP